MKVKTQPISKAQSSVGAKTPAKQTANSIRDLGFSRLIERCQKISEKTEYFAPRDLQPCLVEMQKLITTLNFINGIPTSQSWGGLGIEEFINSLESSCAQGGMTASKIASFVDMLGVVIKRKLDSLAQPASNTQVSAKAPQAQAKIVKSSSTQPKAPGKPLSIEKTQPRNTDVQNPVVPAARVFQNSIKTSAAPFKASAAGSKVPIATNFIPAQDMMRSGSMPKAGSSNPPISKAFIKAPSGKKNHMLKPKAMPKGSMQVAPRGALNKSSAKQPGALNVGVASTQANSPASSGSMNSSAASAASMNTPIANTASQSSDSASINASARSGASQLRGSNVSGSNNRIGGSEEEGSIPQKGLKYLGKVGGQSTEEESCTISDEEEGESAVETSYDPLVNNKQMSGDEEEDNEEGYVGCSVKSGVSGLDTMEEEESHPVVQGAPVSMGFLDGGEEEEACALPNYLSGVNLKKTQRWQDMSANAIEQQAQQIYLEKIDPPLTKNFGDESLQKLPGALATGGLGEWGKDLAGAALDSLDKGSSPKAPSIPYNQLSDAQKQQLAQQQYLEKMDPPLTKDALDNGVENLIGGGIMALGKTAFTAVGEGAASLVKTLGVSAMPIGMLATSSAIPVAIVGIANSQDNSGVTQKEEDTSDFDDMEEDEASYAARSKPISQPDYTEEDDMAEEEAGYAARGKSHFQYDAAEEEACYALPKDTFSLILDSAEEEGIHYKNQIPDNNYSEEETADPSYYKARQNYYEEEATNEPVYYRPPQNYYGEEEEARASISRTSQNYYAQEESAKPDFYRPSQSYYEEEESAQASIPALPQTADGQQAAPQSYYGEEESAQARIPVVSQTFYGQQAPPPNYYGEEESAQARIPAVSQTSYGQQAASQNYYAEEESCSLPAQPSFIPQQSTDLNNSYQQASFQPGYFSQSSFGGGFGGGYEEGGW